MLVEGKGFSYLWDEREFVKYFDRLLATGMSFDEIESKLPQLKDYYFDMVVKGKHYTFTPELMPTHLELFNNWKEFRSNDN